MCRPASVIVLRDRVLWSPNSESHEAIIKEHDVHIDGTRGPNGVRGELLPPHADFRSPVAGWTWHLDQDALPEWWDEARDVGRAREIVEHEWLPAKIVLPGAERPNVLTHVVAVYGRVEQVCGSGRVEQVRGSGSVERVCDSGSVGEVCDSGSVGEVCDSGRVERVCDSGSVGEVCDSGSVGEVCDSGSVGAVCDSGRVERVCDSGSVGSVCGSGLVVAHVALPRGILRSACAVLVDRSGAKPVCYVGQSETEQP